MARFTADDFKNKSAGRFTADMFTASGYAEYERRKKEEEERRAFNNTFAPKIVTTPSATTGGLPETTMRVNVASSLDMFRNQAPNATPKPSPTDDALSNVMNGKPAWAAKENEPLVPKHVDFSTPEAQAKVNVMSAFLAAQAKQAQTQAQQYEAQQAAQREQMSAMASKNPNASKVATMGDNEVIAEYKRAKDAYNAARDAEYVYYQNEIGVNEKERARYSQAVADAKAYLDYVSPYYNAAESRRYAQAKADSPYLKALGYDKVIEGATVNADEEATKALASKGLERLGRFAMLGFGSGVEMIVKGASALAGDKAPANLGWAEAQAVATSAKGKYSFPSLLSTTVQQATQMIPAIAMGGLAGGALGATAGKLAAGAVTLAQSGGNGYYQALDMGASEGQAVAYGTIIGALEAGLQYGLSGIGALGGKLTQPIAKKISNAVMKVASNPVAATALSRITYGLAEMGSEGIEEGLQEILEPVVRELLIDKDGTINISSEDVLYSAIVGALSAGALNAPSIVVNSVSDYKTAAENIDAKAFDNLKNGIATAADIQRIAKSEELFSEAVSSAIVEQTATKDQRVAALTKANEAVKAERLAAGEDLTKTTADVAVETAQQLDLENRMSNVIRLFKGEKLNEAEIGDIVAYQSARMAIQDYVRNNPGLSDMLGLQFFAEKDTINTPEKVLLVGNIEALSKKIQQNNAVANLSKSVNAPRLAQERTGQAFAPVGINNAAKTENAPTGIVGQRTTIPTGKSYYGTPLYKDETAKIINTPVGDYHVQISDYSFGRKRIRISKNGNLLSETHFKSETIADNFINKFLDAEEGKISENDLLNYFVKCQEEDGQRKSEIRNVAPPQIGTPTTTKRTTEEAEKSTSPTAREMYGAVDVPINPNKANLRTDGMVTAFDLGNEFAPFGTEVRTTRIPTMEELVAKYGAIDKKAPTSKQISKRAGLDEHRVARFEQTVAKNVDDVNAAQLQRSVAEGAAGFQETTNVRTLLDANHVYDSLGYDETVKRLRSLFDSDRRVTHKDTALAMRAIRDAAQRGDKATFVDLTASLASISSEMGQAIQALSIFSRLDASGRLMAVQKLVDRWNAKHPSKKKLTDAERQEVAEIRKEITAKETELKTTIEQTQRDKMQAEIKKLERRIKEVNGDYIIPQELVDKFLSVQAGDEAALQELMAAVWKNVGENTEASIWDKLNAWRMLCMLANPTTHLKNIAGNAAFVPARLLRDVIRTGMEKKLSPEERRAAILTSADKASKELAKDYFVKDLPTLQAGGKYNPMSEAHKSQTIFKTMPLEWARKTNFNLLEKEDSWFMQIAYVQAFAQYMKAQGWTADTITDTQLAQVRAYAGGQALDATYRQENAVADFIVSAINKPRYSKHGEWAAQLKKMGITAFWEGLMAFKKTPINVGITAVKYSPLGTIGGLFTWLNDRARDGHISAKSIDLIASGLSGTAVWGIGVLLGRLGMAAGKENDDDAKKRAFDRQNGITEWSLKFGDTYITLDWLAPMCMPLFMGVQTWEAIEDDYNVNAPTFWGKLFQVASLVFDVTTSVADPMSSMSFVSGLNSAIKNASYDAISSDEAAPSFGASLFGNSVAGFTKQFLPTIGSKIADTVDPTARRTTATTALSDVEKLGKSLLYKVPWARSFLQPSIDTWGRTDTQKGFGAGAVRGLDNMLNPGDVNTIRLSDTDKALYDLYERTKDSRVFPSVAKKSFTKDKVKYEMNDTQYTQFATVKGQKSYELVTGLMNHPYWNSLTDEQKIAAVYAAYTYATEVAKSAVFSDIPVPRERNSLTIIRGVLS